MLGFSFVLWFLFYGLSNSSSVAIHPKEMDSIFNRSLAFTQPLTVVQNNIQMVWPFIYCSILIALPVPNIFLFCVLLCQVNLLYISRILEYSLARTTLLGLHHMSSDQVSV